MTTLKLKTEPILPLEAETVTPDRFLGKTSAEIAALPVNYGNQTAALGDFFVIDGDGTPDISIEGDLTRVKLIGAKMTQGRIIVHGDVGMHLGTAMSGGQIQVHGNADDWAGAEMRGGQIYIHGNAGHGVGGAYRGSPKGMIRGLIVVDGNVGNEAGSALRRGMIIIGGDTGEFTGSFMIAGSILVFGRLGQRAGAGMKRGSIVTFQTPKLLPTFRYACTYRPTFLPMLLSEVRGLGFQVADEQIYGHYRRYSGDFTALGKGEILVWEGA